MRSNCPICQETWAWTYSCSFSLLRPYHNANLMRLLFPFLISLNVGSANFFQKNPIFFPLKTMSSPPCPVAQWDKSLIEGEALEALLGKGQGRALLKPHETASLVFLCRKRSESCRQGSSPGSSNWHLTWETDTHPWPYFLYLPIYPFFLYLPTYPFLWP